MLMSNHLNQILGGDDNEGGSLDRWDVESRNYQSTTRSVNNGNGIFIREIFFQGFG